MSFLKVFLNEHRLIRMWTQVSKLLSVTQYFPLFVESVHRTKKEKQTRAYITIKLMDKVHAKKKNANLTLEETAIPGAPEE